MLEKNTDRLFWTLTSIIVGALLLTISVKAFPGVANTVIQPISGITKQADKSTTTADQAYQNATSSNGTSNTSVSNNNSSSNNSNNSNIPQTAQSNDPDAQEKSWAVDVSLINFHVKDNGDGTGTIVDMKDTSDINDVGRIVIPKYTKINGRLIKITNIGDGAFENLRGTRPTRPTLTLTLPDSITSIGNNAFNGDNFVDITLPDSVQTIGDKAFYNNSSQSITLGKNIKTIGQQAFYGNFVQTINIPASTQSIGDQAFYGLTWNPQQLNLANPNTKQGNSVINTTGPSFNFNYGY